MNSSEENAAKRCPECGAIITSESPQALCPACMMQRAFEPSTSEAADDPALTETLDANQSPSSASDAPISFSSNPPANGVELADGQRFGDYTIVRRLGRGGMGTVYEADHEPTGRRVALKVLTHSLDNPQARARFLREGRLAASINHPNSVYVYGTEEIGDTPTISMELIRGGTLQQWVKARGVLDVPAAVDAVLQIIDGLEAADRKGVLHRDVKPANCFIDASGTIKIGDFGLSISTGPRDDLEITNVTREGIFLGTPAFASPEQLRGESLDRRSDIYSVGVTLFYLLTGRAPFTGDNMVQLLATVLDKPAPAVRSIRPDVPEELEVLIQRCLQKAPGQRFASYDALREALLPLSSLKPTPAPLGNRLIANVIDVVAMSSVVSATLYGGQWLIYGSVSLILRFPTEHAIYNVLFTLGMIFIVFLYYALTEWRFGKTLGKHLLGLRVVDGDGRISWRQASVRAALFTLIPNLPAMIYSVIVSGMTFEMMQQGPNRWIGMAIGLSYYLLKLGLFVTARARNGYAGVHELASGTRVICKPQLKTRPVDSSISESFGTSTGDEKIGPYHVLQPLWGSTNDRLLLAYDAKLLRRVWLREQPLGTPEVDSTSRNLSRMTRLRWLGGKRSSTECWDCYEAPTGKPYKQSIDEGLNWQVIVAALRQLAHELKTARQEDSLPETLSLEHLWITEEGSMKILPFAARENLESSASSSATAPSTAMQLLRDAVQYADGDPHVGHNTLVRRGMPLGVRDKLDKVSRVESVDDASQQLGLLTAPSTVNVRRRAAGLLAVSLAVPTLLMATTLIASLVMEQRKSQMPRVAELSKISTLLDIESQMIRPDTPERIAAIETWIAGNYRDVIEDPSQMNDFYALVVIPPDRQQALKALIAKQTPSAEETQAAKEVFEVLMAEAGPITPAEIGFFSFRGLLFLATVAWMELIWFPSLITAIACRGGWLLWAFGVTLVNRHGQRASRLRVFVRMLVGGVPALGIVFVFVQSQIFGTSAGDLFSIAVIALLLCLLAYTLISGRRLPHDRIAGTYLAAR